MFDYIKKIEKYKTILDSFLVEAAIIDQNHRIIVQNPLCQNRYGNKPREYCYRVVTEQNGICGNCLFKEMFNKHEVAVSQQDSIGDYETGQLGKCVLAPIKNDEGKIFASIIFPRDLTDLRRLENQLRESVKLAQEEKAKVEAIVASIGDGLSIQNRDFKILYMNDVLKNMIGDHVGEFCYKAIHDRESICENCQVERAFQDGKIHTNEQKVHIGKKIQYVENIASPLKNTSGQIIGAVDIIRNITKRKANEDALKKAKNELEYQVDKRTAELARKNIALKEILGQIELEKKQMTERVKTNLDQLLLPIIGKIKGKSSNVDKDYVDILEKNIKELTSSFGVKLTDNHLNLTPKEIDICILIKEGFTGKEIAKMHNLSFKTIASHRYNIRKKLGISSKKINLATYLNSL